MSKRTVRIVALVMAGLFVVAAAFTVLALIFT